MRAMLSCICQYQAKRPADPRTSLAPLLGVDLVDGGLELLKLGVLANTGEEGDAVEHGDALSRRSTLEATVCEVATPEPQATMM